MIAPENRGPVLAAALILLVFGVGGYFLPSIILAVGTYSTAAAGLIGILFVLAFFGIFWLRGRRQSGR